MAKALKSLFIAFSQLPVFYTYTSQLQQIKQRPVVAALLTVAYEAAVLIIAFSKEVWEKKLKEKAVQAAGDSILNLCNWFVAWVKNLAPGFRRRYNKQMKLEHEIFNVRGLGLVNNFTLELADVFVDLRIHPSSRKPKETSGLL